MAWFINAEENSEGPFSTEEIKGLLDQGQLPLDSFIWGRGMENWMTIGQWTKGNYSQKSKPVPTEQMWHYARDGVSKGPMNREQLVVELSNIREKDLILVWTKGMKAWADLFEFPDLIEDLGLNRRLHPRAPIKGSVVLKVNDQAHICQLRTISEGGVGISGAPNGLNQGDPVHIEVNAKALGDNFGVKSKVQYTTQLGYIGIKFDGINQEGKSKILQYINDYKKELDSGKKAA